MFDQNYNEQKSEIHDPKWRRAILTVFHNTERARNVWEKRCSNPAQTPCQFVSCSDGTRDLIGVVIGGTMPEDADSRLWDLDCAFTILTEDAEILIVKGWYATAVEQVVEDVTEGNEVVCLKYLNWLKQRWSERNPEPNAVEIS